MGKTRYNKVVEVLNNLKTVKGENVSVDDVQSAIIMNVASSKRMMSEIIIMIKTMKLIEECEDGTIKIR